MRLLRTVGTAGLVGWFVLPLVPLLVWSVAAVWRAPAALPQVWGLAGWSDAVADGGPAAAGRSAVLGLTVAVLATVLGGAAAVGLTDRRLPAGAGVAAVLLAPVALPPVAIALGLDVLLLRLGVPGPVGVVVLLTVAALPYPVWALRVALAGIDPTLLEEARLLGARPGVAVRRVLLPALAPGLAVAAGLAFLVGWSDYVVTLTIGGGAFVTLPLLIGSAAAGVGNEPLVAALSLSAVLPPLAAAVLVGRIARRGR